MSEVSCLFFSLNPRFPLPLPSRLRPKLKVYRSKVSICVCSPSRCFHRSHKTLQMPPSRPVTASASQNTFGLANTGFPPPALGERSDISDNQLSDRLFSEGQVPWTLFSEGEVPWTIPIFCKQSRWSIPDRLTHQASDVEMPHIIRFGCHSHRGH